VLLPSKWPTLVRSKSTPVSGTDFCSRSVINLSGASRTAPEADVSTHGSGFQMGAALMRSDGRMALYVAHLLSCLPHQESGVSIASTSFAEPNAASLYSQVLRYMSVESDR